MRAEIAQLSLVFDSLIVISYSFQLSNFQFSFRNICNFGIEGVQTSGTPVNFIYYISCLSFLSTGRTKVATSPRRFLRLRLVRNTSPFFAIVLGFFIPHGYKMFSPSGVNCVFTAYRCEFVLCTLVECIKTLRITVLDAHRHVYS